MSIVPEYLPTLCFGKENKAYDFFTSPGAATVVIGSGEDPDRKNVAFVLGESGTVTHSYSIINGSQENVKAQVVKYVGTFASTPTDEITEVGLKDPEGITVFYSLLTTDSSAQVSVTAEPGETVKVEVVLVRVTSLSPILVYENADCEVFLHSAINKAGGNPFITDFPGKAKCLFRRNADSPIEVFAEPLDDYLTVGTLHNGNLEFLFNVRLWPSDAFASPFPSDELLELKVGTDSTESDGLITVKWKTKQVREQKETWVVKIPIIFQLDLV